MKRILIVVLIVALAVPGWWFVAAASLERSQESWLAERREDGWQADAEVEVSGFPSGYKITYRDIVLADPETGLSWQAPLFTIERPLDTGRRLTAGWPETQRFVTPEGGVAMESDGMRAELALGPAPEEVLDRLALAAETLRVAPRGTGAWAVARLDASAERSKAPAEAYAVDIRAAGIAPPRPIRGLPDTLEAVSMTADLTFDRPWSMAAIEEARPQPRRIDIARAEARWGELELLAAGRLAVDADGVPSGRLEVKARNWREILAMGRQSGALPDGLSRRIEDGLGLLAQISGNRETLDVPLNFENGRVALGPIPLGPAPRLVLR
ncbi:DUF2125 domain-containing protein [Rhodosalinus sp. FB01]|uniref:DUF2125 domain-containing protein n=1 Tax=Rhodosalinus sp. FB01 TaxID=3239194 RepID=UPI003526773D